MHRLGRITTWVGVIVTLVGFVAGFALMGSEQQQMAKTFLTLVPIGFLLLLTGVVTAFLANAPQGPINPD